MIKILRSFFTNSKRYDALFNYANKDFSKLMLNEHFSSNNDSASRSKGKIDLEISLLSDVIKNEDVQSILDVGCGPGLYANGFLNYGFTYHGLDISPYAIEYAKKTYPNAEFFCNSISEHITDKKYDCGLVLYGLFNELSNELDFLKELKKKLGKKHTIILELMHPQFIDKLVNKSLSFNYRESPSCFSNVSHLRIIKRFFVDSNSCLVNRSLTIDIKGKIKINESHFYKHSFEHLKYLLFQMGYSAIEKFQSAHNQNYFYIHAVMGK
ncbi:MULTISPECIES: class I SAM-dependent methyltransferase [unclassified Moritella]|uniref:class I SAM-dependent methyltransferase n=1 Tax=unclassified Moritella TaxID=2637987 RepID=UPI000796F5AE|nr:MULTISPECIES: class I SAM-dependent methyltransferase [unclassified Moritella]KXO06505.1 putative SAM-dependent methyltransferase [Moritella sp. JT01]MCJ8352003.1 class I SAM-dependent methyltransferase [Moritella sp.]